MVFIWEFNCLKMKYFNGIIDSVSRGYNADAAAFFARVTAAGGSLTLTEKKAVNTFRQRSFSSVFLKSRSTQR